MEECHIGQNLNNLALFKKRMGFCGQARRAIVCEILSRITAILVSVDIFQSRKIFSSSFALENWKQPKSLIDPQPDRTNLLILQCHSSFFFIQCKGFETTPKILFSVHLLLFTQGHSV
jgi:hypothetical protein